MSDWRLSPLKRVEVAAIAALGYPLISALGHTLTWRVDGREHLESIRNAGHQPVMAFWHGRILPATFFFRHRGIIVMTSENFDGEWIARIIERFGYGTARGSSSRGAGKALLRLVREMRRGKAVGFTLDGPRGPAGVAQPGAVWLARATGNPLLPFHLEASAHWTLPSWDRTQIPKPFSTVALAIGSPVYIAAETSDGELDVMRRTLEERLESLAQRARELLHACPARSAY